MRIKKNGQVIRLTESDLKKIVKRVLTEQDDKPSWFDGFQRDLNYIGRDIKRAFGEVDEIPQSVGKLFDELTSAKNWEAVGQGFEEAGKTISGAAEDVYNWVGGLFNEQDEKSGMDKIIEKIPAEKRAKAKEVLQKMQQAAKKLMNK